MNLTTLWKASGNGRDKQPAQWLKTATAQEFISSVAKAENIQHCVKITKGRYGGTFGHWQIALAYAKYLSPEFHIAANKIIKRYIEEEKMTCE